MTKNIKRIGHLYIFTKEKTKENSLGRRKIKVWAGQRNKNNRKDKSKRLLLWITGKQQ